MIKKAIKRYNYSERIEIDRDKDGFLRSYKNFTDKGTLKKYTLIIYGVLEGIPRIISNTNGKRTSNSNGYKDALGVKYQLVKRTVGTKKKCAIDKIVSEIKSQFREDVNLFI